MRTSAKLIGNLVHRVSVQVSRTCHLLIVPLFILYLLTYLKLPYKSGRKIESVEQDPIVKQTGTVKIK